jgi:hypothetical protein
MSVAPYTVETSVTSIQDEEAHDKSSGGVSLEDAPLPLSLSVDGDRSGRGFWRWTAKHDLDAVATQPSVFDDPVTLELYRPPPSYENTHRFDPNARWTFREERVRTSSLTTFFLQLTIF